MFNLSTILDDLPKISTANMLAYGFGCWMIWDNQLPESITDQFPHYGGILMREFTQQAFWFFFTENIFELLGRMKNWSRIRPMPLFIEVMPAKLIVDGRLNQSISMSMNLTKQQVDTPTEFQVIIHPSLKEKAEGKIGLSFKAGKMPFGISDTQWRVLDADPKYSFDSSLGWFFIIKAIIKYGDPGFKEGWSNTARRLMKLIERLKVKHLRKDEYILISIDSDDQLRQWFTEILIEMDLIKADTTGQYWPCVMAVMEKRGMQLADNLLDRFSLDWSKLTPNVPHLPYRTAFILGPNFRIMNIAKSAKRGTLDDLCHVAVISKERKQKVAGLEVHVPKLLVSGGYPHCFYCGLKNHPIQLCPTKKLRTINPEAWEDLAAIEMKDFSSVLMQLESAISSDPVQGLNHVLASGGTERTMAMAMMEINYISQIRMAEVVWRSLGKNYPEALRQLDTPKHEQYWIVLDMLRDGNMDQIDSAMEQVSVQYSRSYIPYVLHAFIALEKGDFKNILRFLDDAEKNSNTPFQKSYHLFLQARFMEIEGGFDRAIAKYQQVLYHSKNWIDPKYRICVCLVKMGFIDQAMSLILEIVDEDAHMFNRALIDPEMEPARSRLLVTLKKPWEKAVVLSRDEREKIDELANKIDQWFDLNHAMHKSVHIRLEKSRSVLEKENFAAFRMLTSGTEDLNKVIDMGIIESVNAITDVANHYIGELKEIQSEASWFPFQKILRRFNYKFNSCAQKLNLIRTMDLTQPENCKKGRELALQLADESKDVKKELKKMMVMRDAVIFGLVFGKTFMWVEIFSVLLSLVLVPTIIYLGQRYGQTWANEKWTIQTLLFVLLTIAALVVSGLRTAISFQRQKERILEEKK